MHLPNSSFPRDDIADDANAGAYQVTHDPHPRNGMGGEAHPADDYHVPHLANRFANWSLEELFASGYQHHGQLEAVPDTGMSRAHGIPMDNCTTQSFPVTESSSSAAPLSGFQFNRPMAEQQLMQPNYAAVQDDQQFMSFPVVDDLHQMFMGDGSENPAYCSLPSLGVQWQTILGSSSLADSEQDAINCSEPFSVVGHHHFPIVGGDMMDFDVDRHTPTGDPLVFRCRHHIWAQGRLCGVLIEGDLSDALEHFSRAHVRPTVGARSGSSSKHWTCRWRNNCGRRVLKASFKRHVMKHIVRWKCSGCPTTFSRNDYALKHAKNCGDGHILMVPQLDDRPKRTGRKGKEVER